MTLEIAAVVLLAACLIALCVAIARGRVDTDRLTRETVDRLKERHRG